MWTDEEKKKLISALFWISMGVWVMAGAQFRGVFH